MPTAAAATVSLLAAAGSRRFYTVPGESFLEVLDEIERDDRLHLVSVRHESGAAFMAEADGRLTGVPAVALASRGPGATNLSIGVQTANYDGTPLLVLLGQVESHRLGQGAFQEVDLAAFYTPITKWTVQARTAGEIPHLVARALDVATSGRPGPVAIAVPADLWGAEIDAAPYEGRSAQAPVPDPGEAEKIVQAVTGAARPVAVVGGGAAAARDEVVAFAERFGVGVYTSFRRQDMFPAGHPHYLGHLGLGTPEETLAALAGTDLILLLGTRLDQITSQGYRFPLPHSRVLTIGTDAARAGGLVPDTVGPVLRALAAHPGRTVDWSDAHRAATRAAGPPADRDAEGRDLLHPADVIIALQSALPDDVIVTNDAGNFAGFLHRYWRFREGNVQLGSANGAMGYAVPAAVGAKLVHPDRTVVAMVGDGGVLMTGQEIETAARHGAAILVIVFQNGLYGTIAMHQASRFGRTAGVAIDPVDLTQWARGLGATAFDVHDLRDLTRALEAARGTIGPVVMTVHADADVISPTTRLSTLTAAHRGGTTPHREEGRPL
jgi:acetolactate synthase-1/2/3 large subunit